MPNSYTQITAPGVIDTFTVPFGYINKSDIHVFVDGIEDVNYTWNTDTTIKTSSVPDQGKMIVIRRVTGSDVLSVHYADASILDADTLNRAQLELFYIIQETVDSVASVMTVDINTAQFSAQNKRIANISTPIELDDAVTLGYFRDVYIPQMQALLAEVTTQSGNAQTASTASASSASQAQWYLTRCEELLATSPTLAVHAVDYANPHHVVASQINLGEVDNTSDANKPLSDIARGLIGLYLVESGVI